MSEIKHVVVILSGKGGVGKSTVTVEMAMLLHARGLRVGVLDVDLCGPSIPTLMGLEGREVVRSEQGYVPVYYDKEQRLAVMSLAFLLGDPDAAVVWRGPKKNAVIKQFSEEVYWGSLDVLLVDTPPGTSDEHLSVVEYFAALKPDGAVLVTTPQNVALADVRREISFCRRVGLRPLGLVENMSGYACPCCGEVSRIFSSGGGELLAKECHVPYIGALPIHRVASVEEVVPLGETLLAPLRTFCDAL